MPANPIENLHHLYDIVDCLIDWEENYRERVGEIRQVCNLTGTCPYRARCNEFVRVMNRVED